MENDEIQLEPLLIHENHESSIEKRNSVRWADEIEKDGKTPPLTTIYHIPYTESTCHRYLRKNKNALFSALCFGFYCLLGILLIFVSILIKEKS